MKRNIIIFASVLILGIVAGVWLCSELHPALRNTEPQRDTVVVEKVVGYTPLELKANTIKLDVLKLSTMAMVFIPYDSTKIIYKDRVQYIAAERQYFFTKTDKAEIWHSGVDSTIDSLSLLFPMTSIVQTKIVERKPRKHAICIGIEANYNTTFNMPVQLEYTYNVKPWMSVYGYAEYELFRKQFGVGAGTQMTIEW